jgi:dihydroorotate dehydrogenase
MKIFKTVYPFFKGIAFSCDPEIVHEFTIHSMKTFGSLASLIKSKKDFKVNSFGLKFKSPIGLAAGLDKNAEAIDFLTSLPFGFIEIGTVTPKPQLGNDKPRLFRYPEIESLRNRMGFNNLGSDEVLKNLIKSNKNQKIIGANLGKNKLTENSDAPKDYSLLYSQFAPHCDYLVINVSSPNTPGLRDLLAEDGLREIFESTTKERSKFWKPLFVKVSPDMSEDQLRSVVKLVEEYKLTGIIATNTTIMEEYGPGGMSGKILFNKAKVLREFLLNEIKDKPEIELIGVGGFSNFQEIKDYWIKGGKLVQIYSSFIFQGPGLLEDIESELSREFENYQVETFDQYLHCIRKK